MRKKPDKKAVNTAKLHRWVPAAALASLLLLGGAARAQDVTDIWDKIARSVAEIIAADLLSEKPGEEGTEAFGTTRAEPRGVTTFDAVGLKDSDVGGASDVVVSEWVEYGTIGSGSSTFLSVPNRHNGPIYLTSAMIQLEGTTSATTRFAIGTSTIALAPNYDAPETSIAAGIINLRSITTSTQNAVIDSVYDSAAQDGGAAIHGSSTIIRIPENEYIVGYMTTGGSSNIHGSSVTSTAGRGFGVNSFWVLKFLKVFATSTP